MAYKPDLKVWGKSI